ncbi:MAG: DUF92 domain-containing protein [candidate division KSB1 bacterium]
MPILHSPPLRDWLVLGGFLILIFMLLVVAEGLRRRRFAGPELTRKAVHLLTGVLILTCPFVFLTALPLLLLAALFIFVNYFSLRYNFFAGIHVNSRPTWGTVFYPISFFILLLLFWERNPLALLVGMSLLAIADVGAALVGENVKAPIKLPLPGDQKSAQGALAMFVCSAILIFCGLRFLGPAQNFSPAFPWLLVMTLALALLATVAEALSWRGSDNLSVPLLSATATAFLMQASPENAQRFLLGEALAMFVAVLSYRLRFLDAGGAVLTFILGTIIFGLGGWSFSLPILAFFVLSSLLSKFGAARKKSAHDKFQKGSRRDFGQVLANGGVAGGLVVLWYLQPDPRWYFLYLGAVAAVTADTWATEIGVLSTTPPRLITSGQIVATGTSGAISNLGLMGALLGALCIAILGWAVQWREPVYQFGWAGAALITFGGVLAHLCDSLLGATIQAQQRCSVCAKVSEKKGECCGVERVPHSGWRWMDNDMVNGLCGLCGVLVVLLGKPML